MWLAHLWRGAVLLSLSRAIIRVRNSSSISRTRSSRRFEGMLCRALLSGTRIYMRLVGRVAASRIIFSSSPFACSLWSPFSFFAGAAGPCPVARRLLGTSGQGFEGVLRLPPGAHRYVPPGELCFFIITLVLNGGVIEVALGFSCGMQLGHVFLQTFGLLARG